tara:strand:+ start:8423 stop:8539 length:117 start_codon:yes stop_codon:yes gene_type:complete
MKKIDKNWFYAALVGLASGLCFALVIWGIIRLSSIFKS